MESPTFSLQTKLPDRNEASAVEYLQDESAQHAELTAIRPKFLEHHRKKKKQVKSHAEESRIGLFTFLVFGRWALRKAAETEPDPDVREVRRNILMRKWKRYASDLMRLSYR